jgi:hypothetical protein
MGYKITQRILECAICGAIPEDGESMWQMGSEYWCESCCEQDDELEADHEY